MHDLRTLKYRLLLILGLGMLVLVWQATHRDKLVVYCAHDAVFAEEVLRDFTKQTGIEVVVKYDTEATKSLGLVEQILRETKQPRCDVFWNNELGGTLDLAERGLLAPHKGAGWQRMPEKWRADAGEWTGFAARLRVVAWNVNAKFANPPPWRFPALAPEPGRPGGEPQLPSAGEDLSRYAIAKPIFGTTLTHYATLWSEMGAARLQAWHGATRRAGLREVAGNAAVMNLVAAGTCDAGWTDTDDYFAAKDAGAQVGAMPFETDLGTICIPNTVAILTSTKMPDHARKLADFLLSARTEVALARGKSRQIPLGPLTPEQSAQLTDDVRALLPHAARGRPLKGLLPARKACLDWLKNE